ncbi:MAG: hypothetical protein HYZ42_11185 [Bacteroidetes bacterium]|nr:hypothetical protein [Bacteroidota bacterium]
MTTCGYTCPKCGGTGYDEQNLPCDWCAPLEEKSEELKNENLDEEE